MGTKGVVRPITERSRKATTRRYLGTGGRPARLLVLEQGDPKHQASHPPTPSHKQAPTRACLCLQWPVHTYQAHRLCAFCAIRVSSHTIPSRRSSHAHGRTTLAIRRSNHRRALCNVPRDSSRRGRLPHRDSTSAAHRMDEDAAQRTQGLHVSSCIGARGS